MDLLESRLVLLYFFWTVILELLKQKQFLSDLLLDFKLTFYLSGYLNLICQVSLSLHFLPRIWRHLYLRLVRNHTKGRVLQIGVESLHRIPENLS